MTIPMASMASSTSPASWSPPSLRPRPYPHVTVVLGGQYGSEGKGEFIAWYVRKYIQDAVVRIGGPNAGHTMTIDGQTFKMRQIPCAWHTSAKLYSGPGALINMQVLEDELEMISHSGISRKVYIDKFTTIVTEEHGKREGAAMLLQSSGSTLEGVGMARADKAIRKAGTWGDVPKYMYNRIPKRCEVVDVATDLLKFDRVLVESTQGFGLSLNYSGHYPQTTSADLTPAQALNDAGLGGATPRVVIGVMRTYPIRVAGNSGPMYREVTWEELAKRTNGQVKPEQTTVTRRIRRIGEWDDALAKRFGTICRPNVICLTMVDYAVPELVTLGIDTPNVRRRIAALIDKVERDVLAPVVWIGIGPGKIVPVSELNLGDL